ncbi:MAG TPA: OmpA family protein [Bacteroidia bacterium]|jgi:outer membrane protein OmpA-like peptidoglycan-associated protein|nr:OmpA family protein [Bacteroidia bacterium]
MRHYHLRHTFIILLLLAVCTASLMAQTAKEYKDGKGGMVRLPLGDLSFADTVISYQPGDPAPMNDNQHPEDALGAPDWKGADNLGFVSLGCGGTLIVKFTNNALVNIEGPDLYIFEVGKFVEPTALSVSKDGKKWIEVGNINGGVSEVDIGDSVKTGERFNYVKLTDLKSECDGLWPGADIDAVAAIGSGMQIDLNSSVLFTTGQWVLKPNAKTELNKVIARVKDYTGVQIITEGHTDNEGTEAVNKALSEKRAKAVSEYFEKNLKGKKLKLSYYGYGAQYPIASNETKRGQEKNRRVEVVVLPLK